MVAKSTAKLLLFWEICKYFLLFAFFFVILQAKMRKIVLIAFILLSITIGYAQYCTQIYQKSVRTLRVRYAEENALLQRPVLFLKNGVVDGTDGMNTLEISFDELSHNVRQYSYKVLHCNMDWSVSGISS